jgi:hypothetical protein
MAEATYDPALADNISRVRFHIGDTDVANPKMKDAEIAYVLANNGDDVGKSALVCLNYLIALLAIPNFTADWLTVDNASARAGLMQLRALKKQEFGLSGGLKAKARHARRADSAQIQAPDFATDGFTDINFPSIFTLRSIQYRF